MTLYWTTDTCMRIWNTINEREIRDGRVAAK
jgi:hypothetical protein